MNTIQFFVKQDRYCEEIKNDFTPDIFEKFKKDNTLDLPAPPIIDEVLDATINLEYSKIECNDIPTINDSVSIDDNIYDIYRVDFNTKLNQYEVYTNHYLDKDVFKLNEWSQRHFLDSVDRYEECCKNHIEVQKFSKIFKNPYETFSSYKTVYEYLKSQDSNKKEKKLFMSSSEIGISCSGGWTEVKLSLPSKTFIL